MTQNHSDIRTRFIFDDMPIRGMHIRLEKVWHHIVNQNIILSPSVAHWVNCWLPVLYCLPTLKTKAR